MTIEGKAFTLYGIREIIDSFDDSPPLYETLLESTEQAVADESPITFELSKSLIDTTCKTILNDKGVKIAVNGIRLNYSKQHKTNSTSLRQNILTHKNFEVE